MQSGMSTSATRQKPPSPKLPAAAQALRWIARPYAFLAECAREFGDVFALEFGPNARYVIFSSPDDIREIFTTSANALRMGSGNAVLQPILGKASLLLLEGEEHLRERRLLMPAFHQRAVGNYGTLIQDAVVASTSHWSSGYVFVAQDVLQDVSIDVILRIVFGLKPGIQCAELKRELVSLLNDPRLGLGLLAKLREASAHPSLSDFQKRFERVRGLTDGVIAERRKMGLPPEDDILSMLLEATDEKGVRRSDEEIRDELLTLVVTGHETTATALSWGLYWISTHDEVQARLRAELRGASPADARTLAANGYLDGVCKEVLRICPIVPSVFREVVDHFSVAGYDFESGTVLSPSVYLTHHREDLYPRSEEFNPERFMARSYSGYEYFPFGGGARRCIGMTLAVFEMKVILSAIVGRFELELEPGQKVHPARRVATMAPFGGPRLRVKQRIC